MATRSMAEFLLEVEARTNALASANASLAPALATLPVALAPRNRERSGNAYRLGKGVARSYRADGSNGAYGSAWGKWLSDHVKDNGLSNLALRGRVVERQIRLEGTLRCPACNVSLPILTRDLAGGWITNPRFTVDHVKDRNYGGLNTGDNLLAMCRICNEKKGKASLEVWLSRRANGAAILARIFAILASPLCARDEFEFSTKTEAKAFLNSLAGFPSPRY